jgi:hypothetical protein
MSKANATPPSSETAPVVDARRCERAVEHLLFAALRFLAGRHREMLDEFETSLSHLWDRSEGAAHDDEPVPEIARLFIKSLR